MSASSMSVVNAVVGRSLIGQGSLWLAVALAGWAVAIVLGIMIFSAWRRSANPAGPLPPGRLLAGRSEPDAQAPAAPRPAGAGVSGVLRWLYHGTEAEAVACLEMHPGTGERLWVEPRGLPAPVVAMLVRRARDALLGATVGDPSEVVTLRWLGMGGPRVLVVLRATAEDVEEAVRFGRYLIEWAAAAGMEDPLPDLERRARAVPGVVWAEVDEPSRQLRLILSEGKDPEAAEPEVRREVGTEDLRLTWIGVPAELPAEPQPEPAAVRVGTSEEVTEPRLRLVEVAFTEDGQATVDVRVIWKGHELRGRGHASATPAGPYYAGAKAVADALRPLLDSEVVVEGLYQASTDHEVPVLIAEVRFEGEPLVGAVVDRKREAHWAGARAVLDAVNRRLVQVAGRSGRI